LPSESSTSATYPIPLSVFGYRICQLFEVANFNVTSIFYVLKERKYQFFISIEKKQEQHIKRGGKKKDF
jgi:hypothetical protein